MRHLFGVLVCSILVGACVGSEDAADPAADDPSSEDELVSSRDIIFSPQPAGENHLTRIAKEIDGAKASIDVAIYSYSDVGIRDALARAVQRGVKVRLIFNDAGDHQRMDPAARASSWSGKLEAAGIDVRYINKIMHHKFMIIDGPRDSIAKAKTAQLVTGSANWSASAATQFDENTIFIKKNAELNLRFQREFDNMWTHTRDFEGASPVVQELSTLTITDDKIPDTSGANVFFTSSNFTARDTTFSTTGANTVSDALVEGINSATSSIHIASGHMRSRPVAEALIAKKQASPNIDIKVYLDAQEYISKSGDAKQKADLESCIAAAGDNESKKRDCTDKGFLFGYELGSAGIDVRYKYYAYRWDFSYAPQMHNKYMIVDGKTLFSGSYNLSDNAEHDTFENMMKLDGRSSATIVRAFEKQFDTIWNTGRPEHKLEGLLGQISAAPAGGQIPIVFEPMALSWSEVTDLKDKIRTSCPAVDSAVYRQQAGRHRMCTR